MTEQERLHKIHELSLQAWRWYKEKQQTEPAKRDDYFWKTVSEDLKIMTRKIENVNCRNFLKDIMMAYINELQGEYCEWLSTKQERLPI